MCNHNHDEKNNCFEYVESHMPPMPLSLVVNGEMVHELADPTMTLLNFLRTRLKLFGAKEGCGEGECGACTIIMDGRTVTSCLILALEAQGSNITTVEGLSKDGELSILQQEFIRDDGLQCGFCTPGMLMSARNLLDRNPNPTVEEVKEGLAGNFCRCTGYQPIIDAVLSAAKREREELK
ncbi:2Fe-2S iron-sulfur cluster-binding protein [Tissierella sp.]|uniref:(2Fe-2S)-binding protein n=1 Tax=Tissierella sp. TaxID=41274 RepID=UPI00285A6314|nr:2Fe-2S iron-sulfur cluster-binding protein [Tissierella sp.]MDR7855267.1 (2Fe-2S)-binding protein [Tissierella sp.]